MKHELHLGGIQYTYDGEIACTHAVIGQRDTEKERPEPGASAAARMKYANDTTAGRYALKPLEWAADESEAQALAAQFTAAGWINVSIVPVSAVIENA